MMEVFRWLAVYHGGRAASYRRQLKIMLENVNGLLSQKPSAASIRQVLKDVVMPSKKLGVRPEWQDCIFPLLRSLREQHGSVFYNVIHEFEKPEPSQLEDCLDVLETLLSKLIAVLDAAKM
jgi:hypothetical protein